LHLACGYGHIGTAELLMAKGADVEAKDKVGQGDRGGWRGVERTWPDSDSHRWSRIGRTMSHCDESSVWCQAGVRLWDGCRLEAWQGDERPWFPLCCGVRGETGFEVAMVRMLHVPC